MSIVSMYLLNIGTETRCDRQQERRVPVLHTVLLQQVNHLRWLSAAAEQDPFHDGAHGQLAQPGRRLAEHHAHSGPWVQLVHVGNVLVLC